MTKVAALPCNCNFERFDFQNSTLNDTETSSESSDSVNKDGIGETGYDRAACAILKVPCRFVSDHPCCDVSSFQISLELFV